MSSQLQNLLVLAMVALAAGYLTARAVWRKRKASGGCHGGCSRCPQPAGPELVSLNLAPPEPKKQ